jgi:Family of unknown function (DUF5996)
MTDRDVWPALPLAAWQPTYATLHLWTQVIGKIGIARTPMLNHWWNATLHLTARGLTTGPMRDGSQSFEIRFDFVDHRLIIETSRGGREVIELRPQTSADFYAAVMEALASVGVNVHIWPVTVELPEAVALDRDRDHASYDAEAVNRWWQVMLAAGTVLEEFRARFIGKCSPVHFFWGSFDLAVTRFSGRKAPVREGADAITRESYSHEVISAGFWPGSGSVAGAAFYAYAAPQPPGFERAPVKPAAARYETALGEYILMYDDMRSSASPRETLLDFLQSTYEAGANLGGWNRAELERS